MESYYGAWKVSYLAGGSAMSVLDEWVVKMDLLG